MNNSSHSFRWFMAVIFAMTFFVVGVTGIPLAVAVHNGTREDTLKQWLSESGIYTSALDATLAALPNSLDDDEQVVGDETTPADGEPLPEDGTGDASDSTETENDPNSPLNKILAALSDHNSAVYREISAVVTPTFLQTSVENILHGTYTWLRGEATEPKFEVVLINDDATLLRILNVGMTEQLAQLPPCDFTAQAGTPSDPFAASCVSENFDTAAYAQTFLDEFATTAAFHSLRESMHFSSDQLHLDPAVLTLVPQQFTLLRATPWILLVILAVGLFLTILITPSWKHGLIVGGVTALVTGGISLTGALLVRLRVVDLFTELLNGLNISADAASSFHAALYPLFHTVIVESMGMIVWWATGLTTLGVVLFVVGMFVPRPTVTTQAAAKKK